MEHYTDEVKLADRTGIKLMVDSGFSCTGEVMANAYIRDNALDIFKHQLADGVKTVGIPGEAAFVTLFGKAEPLPGKEKTLVLIRMTKNEEILCERKIGDRRFSHVIKLT